MRPAPSDAFFKHVIFNIFRMENVIYTTAFAFAELSSSQAHLGLPLSPFQTARKKSFKVIKNIFIHKWKGSFSLLQKIGHLKLLTVCG